MAYGSSASDRLTAVRAAIDACLTAQAYSTSGGNSKTMANLAALRQMEKELMDEVNIGSNPSFQGLYER